MSEICDETFAKWRFCPIRYTVYTVFVGQMWRNFCRRRKLCLMNNFVRRKFCPIRYLLWVQTYTILLRYFCDITAILRRYYCDTTAIRHIIFLETSDLTLLMILWKIIIDSKNNQITKIRESGYTGLRIKLNSHQ